MALMGVRDEGMIIICKEERKGTHECVRPRLSTGGAKVHVNVKVNGRQYVCTEVL